MAYYKKEPTAFTQGTKGRSNTRPEEEQNREPRSDKDWQKKGSEEKMEPCCTKCGKQECACNKINDWQNKV